MRSDNAQPFELVDLCLGVAAQGAQDFTIVLTKRRRCTSQPPIHARITKRRSRSRVRSHFMWTCVVNELERAYDRVCARNV